VVRDCEDHINPKQQFSLEPSSFKVDLLVDNKDNKTLGVTLPFLKRLDDDGQSDPAGKIFKESEQRRRQYEERIKGGKHKAVVRISLTNSSFSNFVRKGGNPLEAKWVIRKRVPTKIIRRELSVPIVAEATTGTADDKDENGVKQITAASNADSSRIPAETDTTDTAVQGGNVGEDRNEKHENDTENKTAIISSASQALPDSVKNKQERREIEKATIFNKDFSLPRYLGDGNDSAEQQEGNWRWEAGRYHNPCRAALADRPVSKAILEKSSYNFVGEVISIHPMQQQKSSTSYIDTLAMVKIRLLVLPEHTHSGRVAHHGPLDLFENDDLLPLEQKDNDMRHKSNGLHTQENFADGNKNNGNDKTARIFLRVPIEELVIVERKIGREYLDSTTYQEVETGRNEMIVKHSYSFSNDAYTRCQKIEQGSENLSDKIEPEKSGGHICRRCRHLSTVSKRLAGIPHTLCERCFDFLKHSDAAMVGTYQKSKSKKYRCDCAFCVDRKSSDLLGGLADEVLESESKLGSTLNELEDYSADRDSGFIATRFIIKSMNPVDFSISPSSLSSFINSASSKPVTKIKARVCKRVKAANAKKNGRPSSNLDSAKRNGSMSPTRLGEKRPLPTIITRNEPFRSTSSRLLPYDVSNRKFDVSASELYQWKVFRSSSSAYPEKPRNLRQSKKLKNGDEFDGDDSGKKKLQGRAARAKQRRLLRGVSSLGVDVDTLAGRETNIRFDRSNIHGWGVFTDVDLRQGEMIIEYRGELIGNAMAEKREKEYEAAKIGSDYMFRIDEHTVCDASKQGNVARFINASCAPNCYPKIIFLDGMKRVVVYAKRDIRAGEELCYDYKFDLEYDPAKRIPCICGAPECRGFLNWDQRYVALPNDATTADAASKKLTDGIESGLR